MSEIIILNSLKTEEVVEKTKDILKKDGIIIYPTDTIYGFGALKNSKIGNEKILKLKGRSSSKPFIFLASDIEMVLKFVKIKNEKILNLMKKFWPGPMTLILPTKFNSIAFRIPDNQFCLKLVSSLNEPISSTSINKANNPPMTNISAIANLYNNDVDLIIDDGNLSGFKPSTIIDFTKDFPQIVRHGVLSNKIEEFLYEN